MRMTEQQVRDYQSRRSAVLGEETARACDDESKLHDQIIAECKRRGWYYVHSRMDRATTQAKGVPDFIIAAPNGKTFWIEAKGKGKKATTEQLGAIHWLINLGHISAVVWNLEEFINVVG